MKNLRLNPLVTAMALASCPLLTQAAVFTVDSVADSGPGSLRDAIAAANAAPGAPHDVYFDLPAASTIILTSGQISIDQSMTLHGPGPDELTISGNHSSRIFRIDSPNLLEATISGMTLADGRVESSTFGEIGGAILASGNHVDLTVSLSRITGNQATANAGGGIGTGLGASLNCYQSVISDNLAGPISYGGGIDAFGDVTLNNCDLIDNQAGRGGAISVFARHLEVQNSTISGNTGIQGPGGILLTGTAQIYAGSYPASASITNSLIMNNTGGGNGGCIAGYFADIDIQTSLISGCEADFDGGGIYLAGLSYPFTDYSNLTIHSSDIVNNYSARHGGAILAGLSAVTIEHTLFDDNMAAENGGALNLAAGSQFPLADVQLNNNSADHGAAIHSMANQAGSVIERVNMSLNQSTTKAAAFLGGGELMIIDSLIANNSSAGSSGMRLENQTASVVNTTIANNQVTIAPPYSFFTTGLTVDGGDVTISNSTVAFNHSPTAAAGVSISANTTTSMTSTLVAMNSDVSGNGEISQIRRVATGTTLNGDHNLVSAAAADLFNGVDLNNLVVADPSISPLSFNGGNLATVALQAASPARNAGLNPLNLPFDQRGPGFPRISGPSADIGAFELGPADVVDEIFSDRFE